MVGFCEKAGNIGLEKALFVKIAILRNLIYHKSILVCLIRTKIYQKLVETWSEANGDSRAKTE